MSVNLLKDLGYDEDSTEVRHARAAAAMYSDVIDQLVGCREEAGLNQKEVAKLMRTSQSTVSEFESATADARFSTLIRYAQAVDCEMVIEITKPAMKPVADWVHISVKDEAVIIPFPIRSSQISVGEYPQHSREHSQVSNYVLAVK